MDGVGRVRGEAGCGRSREKRFSLLQTVRCSEDPAGDEGIEDPVTWRKGSGREENRNCGPMVLEGKDQYW